MRRRRCSARAGTLAAAIAALAAGAAKEGAAFLLIPVGARALGMGQAVVADQPGSEAVWWNPAGLARADKREVAVHHYQSIVGRGDVLSIVIPSSLLGVLTASVYILDYGTQEGRDPGGGDSFTAITPRNLVYAATYATPIGARINAGVTLKLVQLRIDCEGVCPENAQLSASSSALDVGAQYDASDILPIALGVSVRNLGPRLQVNDREQADPLPTRIQVGAMYRVTPLERYAKNVDVHLTGDLIDELSFTSPTVRVGADLSYRRAAHLRGGYVFREFAGAEQYGPSIGVGLAARGLYIDVARQFEAFSRGVGDPPTYFSLRYLF